VTDSELQHIANARLVEALRELDISSRQDDIGRIYYTDGDSEIEVAVALSEDSDEMVPWTLGQYALGLLEAGDIEVLWWPMDDDDPEWRPSAP
jgi:hypothetical protein